MTPSWTVSTPPDASASRRIVLSTAALYEARIGQKNRIRINGLRRSVPSLSTFSGMPAGTVTR